MRRALLDVNVLLALLDSDHVDHERAHGWLDKEIAAGWASCAITENGFVRVVSQARYPSPVSPTVAIDLLERACEAEHHEFWPCDLSLLDAEIVDRRRLHGPRQVTDAYLLALATARDGRFVTFDRSLPRPRCEGRRTSTWSCCSRRGGATMSHMNVGTRELRNRTADVIAAVESGERVTLTVRGRPVADIVPHGRRAQWLSGERLSAELVERAADPELQDELDALAGQTLADL